jgi:hypothetical protein
MHFVTLIGAAIVFPAMQFKMVFRVKFFCLFLHDLFPFFPELNQSAQV